MGGEGEVNKSTFRNNEINANICWKDAHFQDHLLPNYLVHLYGSQGGFQRVSHPCYSDKRRKWVSSLVVCACVFHLVHTRIPM